MEKIYVDNAATTKLDSYVLSTMIPYLNENYGNASSIYSIGKDSKKAINDSRLKVAKTLNCVDNEIYFTSGGSESNNTAIKGIAFSLKEKGNHIITSKIEHSSVLESCRFLETIGFEITYVNVEKNGIINLEELKKSIRKETILISIMFANNEIGTIQPIKEIGKIARENKIFFHTDAVQIIGNMKIDVNSLNIDLLSMSAHKFYGPKGIGALYVRKGINITPCISGGHQERGVRAGTENVASIVGLGYAIQKACSNLEEHNIKLKVLRDYYFSEMKKITSIKINGDVTKRLPGNTNIILQNIDSEALVYNLDKNNICASSGSACSAGINNISHVLIAIGCDEKEASSSLRITFGKYNTKNEVDIIVKTLRRLINILEQKEIKNNNADK